jgi:multidrug efflux system outer membrane protein
MARVEQSRAAAASVRSGFYPVVTLNPSASRSRTPSLIETEEDAASKVTSQLGQVSRIIQQINSLAQGGASTPTTGGLTGLDTQTLSLGGDSGVSEGNINNSVRVPFDLTYEIDLWGRLRRSYESAVAQATASAYDFEVVRQTLLADVARNYFNLRSFDAQYQILTRNLAVYEEQVDLTRSQYEAGLIDNINVLQAEVQLESTRAQAADTRRQRLDLEHAIAILVGRAPADFALAERPLATTPPAIPAGLPADLLARRPDIAVAEQNLVSASAEIGVAIADFYPAVSLTGSAGFQSDELQGVLDWKNRAWSIGPNVSLPIFKGGALKANVRQASARFDELEATYRNNILSAYGEVEDSLTDLHLRADAAAAQAKAVASAREYLRLTQIEYQTGVTDYLHVVAAEQAVLNNELAEAQLLNQRMVSTVLLIKALGGGWQAR